MTITKKDLERILDNLDEDAKETFLSMPREDQLVVILAMEGSNSNRLAVVEKTQITFNQDLDLFKNELRSVRKNREQRERDHYNDIEDTTVKIKNAIKEAFSQRFDGWVYFRDRILPTLLTAFLLALLYLAFGGQLPR